MGAAVDMRHRAHAGLQNDLRALVLLIAEHGKALRRILERQMTGDDEARIDPALFNEVEQRLKSALGASTARLRHLPMLFGEYRGGCHRCHRRL